MLFKSVETSIEKPFEKNKENLLDIRNPKLTTYNIILCFFLIILGTFGLFYAYNPFCNLKKYLEIDEVLSRTWNYKLSILFNFLGSIYLGFVFSIFLKKRKIILISLIFGFIPILEFIILYILQKISKSIHLKYVIEEYIQYEDFNKNEAKKEIDGRFLADRSLCFIQFIFIKLLLLFFIITKFITLIKNKIKYFLYLIPFLLFLFIGLSILYFNKLNLNKIKESRDINSLIEYIFKDLFDIDIYIFIDNFLKIIENNPKISPIEYFEYTLILKKEFFKIEHTRKQNLYKLFIFFLLYNNQFNDKISQLKTILIDKKEEYRFSLGNFYINEKQPLSVFFSIFFLFIFLTLILHFIFFIKNIIFLKIILGFLIFIFYISFFKISFNIINISIIKSNIYFMIQKSQNEKFYINRLYEFFEKLKTELFIM